MVRAVRNANSGRFVGGMRDRQATSFLATIYCCTKCIYIFDGGWRRNCSERVCSAVAVVEPEPSS